MTRKIVATALIFVSAFHFAPAVAAENLARQEVSYRDLELTSADGQKTLEGRIRRAARIVCGGGEKDLSADIRNRRCRQAAIAGAQPQIMLALARARMRSADAGSQAIVMNTLR